MKIRWTIIVTVVVVLGVLGTALFYTVRKRQWRSEFEAKVQALRDAGEAVELIDLAPPEVPDEENAAVLYEEAWLLMRGFSDNVTDDIDTLGERDVVWSDDNLARAAVLRSQIGEALEVLHRADGRPRCRFNLDYSVPPHLFKFSHLQQLRESWRVVRFSARMRAREGDADGACADVRAALRLAGASRGEPSLISFLTQATMRVETARLLGDVMSELDPSEAVLRDLDRALAPLAGREDFVLTMRAERSEASAIVGEAAKEPGMARDIVNYPMGGSLGRRFRLFVFPSTPYRVGSYYLDVSAKNIAMAAKPWHATKADRDALSRQIEVRRQDLGIYAAFFNWDVRDSAVFCDLSIARVGAARLGIALRLYRMKHGAYPDKLAGLVPEFIDKLPVDPFSGADYLYRREGSGFAVHSVGANGTDDGATDSIYYGNSIYVGDLVFRVTR